MSCPVWIAAGLTLAALSPAPHCAPLPEPGRLVGISVEIDGRATPLYPAPDGSGRWYVEARRGSAYAVRLDNRTGERLGVELRVDGLDVISGEAPAPGRRGRLYVLSPGGTARVRGWRTSLDSVQRFEFVDERRSYAVRAEKSGARLGWIEARVFRERREVRAWEEAPPVAGFSGPESADRERPARRPSAAPGSAEGDSAAAESASRDQGRAAGAAPSHPGTGWGRRVGDRAQLVDFEAEPAPVETLALRYEYADALAVLGVGPACDPWARLWERERGETGFAQPPRH